MNQNLNRVCSQKEASVCKRKIVKGNNTAVKTKSNTAHAAHAAHLQRANKTNTAPNDDDTHLKFFEEVWLADVGILDVEHVGELQD